MIWAGGWARLRGVKHTRCHPLAPIWWTLAGLLLALASSCSTINRVLSLDFVDLPETRLANLEALHTPTGKHHYSAEMIGDFQYVMGRGRRSFAGVSLGRAPSSTPGEAKMEAIENPAELCLEILSELLDFDPTGNPRLAGVQVSWSARIVIEDPSVLSRARAARGLGEQGARIGIGLPRQLAAEEPRATPDDVARLLSDLLTAWQNMREGTRLLSGSDAPSVAQAMQAIRETTYDVNGARRVLVAVGSLFASTAKSDPGYAELVTLNDDLQRITIERALAQGILDSSPAVRAAIFRAAVLAGGNDVLMVFMGALQREQDPLALRLYLEVVLERGLPAPSNLVSGEEYLMLRERWLELLVTQAAEHPRSEVRVKAMQVLQVVAPDGPRSLREEDWETWWFRRTDQMREEAGLPPLPGTDVPGQGDRP